MSPEQRERKVITQKEAEEFVNGVNSHIQTSMENWLGVKLLPGERRLDGTVLTEEDVEEMSGHLMAGTLELLAANFRILEETPEFHRRMQAATEFAQALVKQLRETGDIDKLRGVFFAGEGSLVIEAALEGEEFSGDPFLATVKADTKTTYRHPLRYASSHPYFVTDMTDEELAEHFENQGYYPVDLSEILSSAENS